MYDRDPFAINNFLRSRQLATLAEAGPLMSQLGMFVRDHAHFRQLLTACEPEHRTAMYECLAPNLLFKAKPLHEYLIEANELAEREQLPFLGEKGELIPYKIPELKTGDEKIAQDAIREAIANEHLWVSCVKCLKEAVFHGITKRDAITALREAGWKRVGRINSKTKKRERGEMCPDCIKKTIQ